jgi:hypothetical protein
MRELLTLSPASACANTQRPPLERAGWLPLSSMPSAGSTLLPVAVLNSLRLQLCEKLLRAPGPTRFENSRRAIRKFRLVGAPSRRALTTRLRQRAVTRARAGVEPVFSRLKFQPFAVGIAAATVTSGRAPRSSP